MAGFENDIRRDGFNNAVGMVELRTTRESANSMDIARFTAIPVEAPLLEQLGIPRPDVRLSFDLNARQLEALRNLDQSGRTGASTNLFEGRTMNILRNDEQGITFQTAVSAPDGRPVAAQITFATPDINEALESLTAKQNLEPRFDTDRENARPIAPYTYNASL